MKKIFEAQAEVPIQAQLDRLERALGPEWMSALDVAPETVRTWKKRKAVPLSQLQKASRLSERHIDWFISNQEVDQKAVFFASEKKQVSQFGAIDRSVSALQMDVLANVMTMVDEELEALDAELSFSKKAQLVAVLYQRFVERAIAGVTSSSDKETVQQYLKLVA